MCKVIVMQKKDLFTIIHLVSWLVCPVFKQFSQSQYRFKNLVVCLIFIMLFHSLSFVERVYAIFPHKVQWFINGSALYLI